MRKSTLMIGLLLVLTVVCCINAYAATGEEVTAWQGFWNSVGGFAYNSLPWKGGNWMGGH